MDENLEEKIEILNQLDKLLSTFTINSSDVNVLKELRNKINDNRIDSLFVIYSDLLKELDELIGLHSNVCNKINYASDIIFDIKQLTNNNTESTEEELNNNE